MANNHELNEIFKVQIYFPKVWKINKYVYLWSVFFCGSFSSKWDVYFVYEYI